MASRSSTLVIVESPTKAKTIGKFLTGNFHVTSSYGHVRDLPKQKMGIDIEHNFEPQYVVPKTQLKRIAELKSAVKKADTVILATDEDREGEAIAWHLVEALDLNKPKLTIQRIAFHEITKEAILKALEHPRDINIHLVDAQQTRRIIDRLVGYELSPFLWRKIARGLSAGRVQSAALRLVVEREREIKAFKKEEYWTIEGQFLPGGADAIPVSAELSVVDGKKLKKMDIGNTERAEEIVGWLKHGSATVADIKTSQSKRSPLPPFTTSTLQQEANHRLGYSAKQTMMLAQQLYEGVEVGAEGSIGLITYMRTDAVNLSEKFLADAQVHISKEIGAKYWTEKRLYKTKSKLAQEAHEAIRPTEVERTPSSLKSFLEPRQWKLYDLIWRRAVASQMCDAQLSATTVIITLDAGKHKGDFQANGSVIEFDGFYNVYPPDSKLNQLPHLTANETLKIEDVSGKQHFTQPPARYSDATLVKSLEEYGIGRPSTYAPTISTLIDRSYVERDPDRRLAPSDMAALVIDVLKEHFPQIVDFQFTANLEDKFDAVAQGTEQWQPVVSSFYQPFHQLLMDKEETVSKKSLTEEATDQVCEKCSKPMIIKIGRFGKFLACSGYPECKNTKEIAGQEKNSPDTTGPEGSGEPAPQCEKCGKPMQMKHGRFGTFWGCTGYPECKNLKPMTKSTGVACPECGKGEVVERKSKKGRIFFSCNKYPECTFAMWNKPAVDPVTKQAMKCPQCQSLLAYGAKGTLKCSNKECGHTQEATVED